MTIEPSRRESLQQLKAISAAIGSPWISEIVLQTNQYDLMKLWYEAILGGDWIVENTPDPDREKPKREGAEGKQVFASDVRACFMRLPVPHPYTMTFALFEITSLDLAPKNDPGLNHMQLKHGEIDALVRRVEALRDHGMHPHRAANHGTTTSFYFRDPDQNIVELCIDNFDTPAEKIAFINSPAFKQNPSGISLDRDDFLAKYRGGTPTRELLAID